MKKLILSAIILSTMSTFALAKGTHERKGSSAKSGVSAEKKAAYDDIRATLGVLPAFFESYPDAGVAAWWQTIKEFELNPDTALSGKVKELIGLGVAAQIPCEYCTYFHQEAAKLNGATQCEMEEAVAVAALTREGSTILNGTQVDFDEFRADLDRIVTYVKAGKSKPGPVSSITDAKSAYRDAKRTLGVVPGFLRGVPEPLVAGFWKELRTVQLNPETNLSGKEKELIGLAVASQIPCRYCIVFHTEAAKLNGATDEEIKEAVAMAALTRHGSTVLNGNRVDKPRFYSDFDKIMSNARRSARK